MQIPLAMRRDTAKAKFVDIEITVTAGGTLTFFSSRLSPYGVREQITATATHDVERQRQF
jgi:hypothetical protein